MVFVTPLPHHLPCPADADLRPGLWATNMVDGLAAAARRSGAAATIFPSTDGRITTSDLARASARAASAMSAAGVGDGAVVGILQPTGVDQLVSLFGVVGTGAAASMLPVPATRGRSDVERLVRIIDAAGTRHLLVHDQYGPLARELHEARPGVAVLRLDTSVSPRTLPAIDPDACALVQFTSGTTGRPRGVVLSHRAIMAGIRAIRASAALTPDDVLVQWVPLYHDMGLFGLLSQVFDGATTHAFEPLAMVRSPAKFLTYLARCRGTVVTGPNFVYEMLCDAADRGATAGLDLSRWRVAFNGAETVRASTVERFQRAFAPSGVSASTMYPVYGMAEATLAVTFSRPGTPAVVIHVDRDALVGSSAIRTVPPAHERAKAIVSVGVPVAGVDVRLVHTTGSMVGPATVGDIQISGTPITSGYYRDPAATADSFDGGWFRTGDVGFWHDGQLYIAGRRKEMVIMYGRNYFPDDAEAIARDVAGVFRHHCVAFADSMPDGEEALGIAVESAVRAAERPVLGRRVREKVSMTLGLSRVRVYVVEPRWLTRTTSGKWERLRTKRRLTDHAPDASG